MKRKILIAEDEFISAMFIKQALETAGHQVLKTVSKGEIAIEEALHEKPDVIIMDINLSGKIKGDEAVKKIYERYNIPVIFITGYTINKDNPEWEHLNVLAVFEKPLSMKKIIDLINEI